MYTEIAQIKHFISGLFLKKKKKACIFNANLILLEMKNEHFIIRVRSAQCDDDY